MDGGVEVVHWVGRRGGELEKGMRIEKHFEVYGHVFMQKMAGKRTPHPHAEELGFMT